MSANLLVEWPAQQLYVCRSSMHILYRWRSYAGHNSHYCSCFHNIILNWIEICSNTVVKKETGNVIDRESIGPCRRRRKAVHNGAKACPCSSGGARGVMEASGEGGKQI